MGIYHEDIVDIDLSRNGTICRSFMNKAIGEGDTMANRFGVRIFRNGEEENIESSQCQGFFMAPDGTNILISGSDYTSVDGNKAWVQLPQGCYANEGQFSLAIKLIGGGVTGTMRIVDGVVSNTGATGAVMPTSQVPTSAEIIAAYDQAIEVIDNSVRFDITQDKTDAQKKTARENIGAASAEELGKTKESLNSKAEALYQIPRTIVDGYYIKVDGTYGSSDATCYGVFDVSDLALEEIRYDSYGVYNIYACFYDSNDEPIIETIDYISERNYTKYANVPEQAATLKVSCKKSEVNTLQCFDLYRAKYKEDIQQLADNIVNTQRAHIDINDVQQNISVTNYIYLFERSVKTGQSVHINASVGSGASMILYKILKKNDISQREVISSYVHNETIDVISTEEKPIWGIMVYITEVESQTETLTIRIIANSYDDTADDYSNTKMALYRDISYSTKLMISAEVGSNYYQFFPYKLFPGQKLHYNYSISGGSFYLYKLFSRTNTENRKVIDSARSVGAASGIIVGEEYENFVGFMVWVDEKIAGSILSVEYHAEGYKIEDTIIPRAEIEPVLANLNYSKTAFNADYEFKPFVALHFSDLHGDLKALERIINFRNKYTDYLDEVIHTGDAVYNSAEGGYSSIWTGSTANILPIIGNHDAYTDGTSGCKAWTTGYSAKWCYGRYISPVSSLMTTVEDKCYWSKKKTQSKIMLIAIDNYHWKEEIVDSGNNPLAAYPNGDSVDNGEQKSWFISKLNEAKSEGYAVVVLCHEYTDMNVETCPFTSMLNGSTGGHLQHEAIEAVQDFIDGGGEFITWVCGHTHWDLFGTITGYPDQTMIVIDSARAAARTGNNNWEENARVEGARSENLFNLFAVDRNKKIITLFRVGMEYDKFGRHIGSLVYDYDNKEVIWNS